MKILIDLDNNNIYFRYISRLSQGPTKQVENRETRRVRRPKGPYLPRLDSKGP